MPEIEYKTDCGSYGLTNKGHIWEYEGSRFVVHELTEMACKSIAAGRWAGYTWIPENLNPENE